MFVPLCEDHGIEAERDLATRERPDWTSPCEWKQHVEKHYEEKNNRRHSFSAFLHVQMKMFEDKFDRTKFKLGCPRQSFA